MLHFTVKVLKKGWTQYPGHTRRGGKNLAWRPKMRDEVLSTFVPINLVHPDRHPNNWQQLQFNYLGYTKWPKQIGFYNAGDNFELTPQAAWRIYRHCRDELFWSRLHNQKTIIHLLPKIELNPQEYMQNILDIFRHHLKKFGADHYIYNAVMQAAAFAKDLTLCERLFSQMKLLGLQPNIQSYVNMMLACKLCNLPSSKIQSYFHEGMKKGAIEVIMRADTEFNMWMDQLNRLGSFTSKQGYLSVKDEGAKSMPRDMWALWGWHKSESKFISRTNMMKEQIQNRVNNGKQLVGTVYTKTRRQPWALYNGLFPWDYKGPKHTPPTTFNDAPLHTLPSNAQPYVD